METNPKHRKGRTQHSVIEDAPPPKYDHHHKRGVMVFGVVFSMVIIAGLYAASYRYSNVLGLDGKDAPRWSTLKDEFLEESKPLTEEFLSLKDTVTGILTAQKVKASSIEILKGKIESSSSTEAATTTSEISETQPES